MSSTSSAAPSPHDWYLLHARLKGIKDPVIWRQLSVPSNITTSQLHPLMIAAFVWSRTHLHNWSIRPVEGVTRYEAPLISNLNPDGYRHPVMRVNGRKDDDYGLPPDETLAELDAIYDFTGGRHILLYEYDMGDGWEHVITVERMIAPTARITGGKGHSVGEDSGGPYGWAEVKAAYKVKDTPQDDEDKADRRDWYENMCSNGDKRGLKGKARLEHVNLNDANKAYESLKDRKFDSEDEGEGDVYYYGTAGQ